MSLVCRPHRLACCVKLLWRTSLVIFMICISVERRNFVKLFESRFNLAEGSKEARNFDLQAVRTRLPRNIEDERLYRCQASYLGCIHNNNGAEKIFLRLTGKIFDDNTVQKCILQCYLQGLELSAVQRTRCYCAKFFTPKQRIDVRRREECAAPCPGNSNATCGDELSMQTYLRNTPCHKGPFTQGDARSAEFGCYSLSSLSGFVARDLPTVDHMRPIDCLLECEKAGFHLAMIDENAKCSCGNLSGRANWTNAASNASLCSQKCPGAGAYANGDLMCGGPSHVSLWRTLVEESCGSVGFLKPGSVPLVGLVSMPGSGNSWLRHLIETGIGAYTGSVYHSMSITRKGMFGEMEPATSNRTLTIKDHVIYRGISVYPHKFDKIILLLRNPYDAIIAEFNRRMTGSQTGHVNSDKFQSARKTFITEGWYGYLKWIISGYEKVYREVLTGPHPMLVITYDDLKRSEAEQLYRILDFVGYQPANLQRRLACLKRNSEGRFKRKAREATPDPYTYKDVRSIDKLIALLRSGLAARGFGRLPKWERTSSECGDCL